MQLLKQCRKPSVSHIIQRSTSSTARIFWNTALTHNVYQTGIVEVPSNATWEKEEYYRAECDGTKPSFSMVLPPPNITGRLHLGHALANVIQDVIARRHRGMGMNVLWLPGTDHAGIATQTMVEKNLKAVYNVDPKSLGPEAFNEHVNKWKDKNCASIIDQLKRLGCTLDWTRSVFTMDPHHCHAVETAFINLFHKGLVYRKNALVNWSYSLNSTIADIELDNLEIDGPTNVCMEGYSRPVQLGWLYSFAYKMCGEDGELVVATTQPETMMGDAAVAVHPSDTRYSHLQDARVMHPFTNRTVPVIFDEAVDMNFESGAVKVTPAHSKIDYDIATRHNLPILQVINEKGKMINTHVFDGMKKYECREKIVSDLANFGLLRKVRKHKMNVPICGRSRGLIEYLPKQQWFVNCKELNKKATEAVASGLLTIIPDKHKSTWDHWCKDDKDWCISRQLYWGHQIPAYRCGNDKERQEIWVASTDAETARNEAAGVLRTTPDFISVVKDSDVLDTWFSSAIYPFASLGWPDTTMDLNTFFPLSLMVTGHDILGFWVHRMVMLSLALTDKLPFNKVLLHGVICDNKGHKMSKSKGNVIDPLDIIYGIPLKKLQQKTTALFNTGLLDSTQHSKALEYQAKEFGNTDGIPECGLDAFRFTLLSNDIKSHYVQFDLALAQTNKLFCNKIWQSVVYTELCYPKLKNINEEITRFDLNYFDRWILSRLATMVETYEKALDNYDFHIATRVLKTFMYNDFCDFYIESTKHGFKKEDPKIAYGHAHTLSACLNTSLRLMSLFMVYLPNALIPCIPNFESNIIYNYSDQDQLCYELPKSEWFKQWHDKQYERRVEKLLSAVELIRQLKGFYGISNKARPTIYIKTDDENFLTDFDMNNSMILNLTKCGGIMYGGAGEMEKDIVSGLVDTKTTVGVQLIGAEDIDVLIKSVRKRLMKKISKIDEHIEKLEKKFASANYLENVPMSIQIVDRDRLELKKREKQELQRLLP